MKKLTRVLAFIDGLSNWSGKVVSMLIFPMIAILMYEVVSRYGFNAPTLWAHEITRYIYGAHFMLGGAYTLYLGQHVSVDIFYARWSPRVRAMVDLVTYLLFLLLGAVLLWYGSVITLRAFTLGETSSTPLHAPFGPLKAIVPVAAFLILLQGIAGYIRNIITITRRELL